MEKETCNYVFSRGLNKGKRCPGDPRYEGGRCCRHRKVVETKKEQIDSRIKDMIERGEKEEENKISEKVGEKQEKPQEKQEKPQEKPEEIPIKVTTKEKAQNKPQVQVPDQEVERISTYIMKVDGEQKAKEMMGKDEIKKYFEGDIKGVSIEYEKKEDERVKIKLEITHKGKIKINGKKVKEANISLMKKYQNIKIEDEHEQWKISEIL